MKSWTLQTLLREFQLQQRPNFVESQELLQNLIINFRIIFGLINFLTGKNVWAIFYSNFNILKSLLKSNSFQAFKIMQSDLLLWSQFLEKQDLVFENEKINLFIWKRAYLNEAFGQSSCCTNMSFFMVKTLLTSQNLSENPLVWPEDFLWVRYWKWFHDLAQ